MGNALEFILKLQDMLTPAMRQAARVSDTASAQIQSQFAAIQTSGKRMSASVDELRARLEAVNRVRFSTTIEREFNVATRAAQRLESQIERMEGRGRSGGGLMGSLGGLIPGIGLGAGIGKAVTASADAEMSKMSYSTLLGSKQKGAAMYSQLNKFGNDTVLDNQTVYNGANTLLAFGTAGEKVLPTLKMLGDVSLGNKDKFSSLTLAFAQTQSAGKLMGQDLLQYVAAGFNPLNEISKMTGASVADLRKKMSDGAITSDMVTKAFEHATAAGGLFHDALKNSANTVTGKWGILMGTVQTRLVALGDWLQPATKWVIDFFGSLLDGDPVLWSLVAVIGVWTTLLYANTIAINVTAIATKAWAGAQAIINMIMNMNPIVLIITLIVTLGLIIYGLVKQYDGWGKSMQGLWEIIKGFGALAVNAFKNMGEGIVYWLEYAWLKTKGFFQWIGGAVANVATALKLAVEFDFDGAKKALSANITVSATKDIANLEAQHKAGQVASQQAATAALAQMAAGGNMIGLHKAGGSASGVNPVSANGGAGAGGGIGSLDLGGDTKKKSEGINGGGQRSIVINIGKQIEKLEVHVMDAKEGVNEIESMVREAMRKVMYSLNGVAPN